jgi:abortive infection bacteriophage resistance protein
MENNDDYIGEINANVKPLETLHVNLTSKKRSESLQARIYVKGDTFPIATDKQGSVKQPVLFEQMTAHLRQRIKIDNEDEIKLRQLIREKMYFRIAYFSKLLYGDAHSGQPTLDDLINLFEFDSYLRASIARLTPAIEQFAKATLVELLLNKKLDAEIYLDKSLYKYKSRADKLKLDKSLSLCASEIKMNRTTNDAVKHHIEYHGGHIPIWIVYDVLPFGKFNMLTTRFEKSILRDWIGTVESGHQNRKLILQTGPKTLPSFLQTVQLLRNAAAHNARVYGKKFVFNPSIKTNNEYWQLFQHQDFKVDDVHVSRQIHSLFTGLMVMRYFYACMSATEVLKWESFRQHLIEHCQNTKFLNLKGYLGFPDNWKELLRI